MKTIKRSISLITVFALFFGLLPVAINEAPSVSAAANVISNDSLSATIGDLGQIEVLNIKNNPLNKKNAAVNFVLPNSTSPQNDVQHQWMGEMIFSYRTGDTAVFPNDRVGFVEVDTNKTLAAGGSTKYTTINANNPYFTKTASSDGKKVEVNFIGQPLTSTASRVMKGFDVKSVFNMDTTDGSLQWEITLKNKSNKYIEFGDIGLPMPWNNKYLNVSDTYDNRVTVHNFAGADSGYSYAIRTSGEGNFMMFAPVPESGARIEYVDYWLGDAGEARAGSLYSNWVGDSGGWFPGLNVLYIHSKDISRTGRGYFTDASSLVLAPQAEKTYKFKFSAVRAGDNTPQINAASPNNASTSMEDREKNLRSILYKSGMIDAVALPGFQAAINMPVKLDLHFDNTKIDLQSIEIQNILQNDPYDAAHIPVIKGTNRAAMVNNTRTGRGLPSGNPGYTKSVTFLETKIINGEQHHIYALTFDNLGNNSVRVNYKLKSDPAGVNKFTQFEFNILAELDQTSQAHSQFMVDHTQDKIPTSPTFGIYRDWYLTTGLDTVTSHWGDDWSHDNINFMTMKNYLDPEATELRSIENYLIDFMWKNYMKYTQSSFRVANYLNSSGIYSTTNAPYVRTFSEAMVVSGYFNMYRIQKAYPNLIEYRETPQFYLEKAYGIYYNRVGTGPVGFYGEQQIPDLIEALKEEGMLTEYNNLKTKFAQNKATSVLNAAYPYGSEFEYDNTGEEGAYAAAKALRTYYPQDPKVAKALESMKADDLKTRAMRGIQPTWYFYSVPVFRAGEGWWNFQYTASLAGSIMDDMLRYQADGRTPDQTAVAQQRNYAAKISNFNAINMGQISAQSVGSTAWRFNAHKGGTGTKDVYDGGTRVMNNGWQDFSGEAEEGLYGSLLRISSDIVIDPVFGLFGYGATVTDVNNKYNITPKDGFGKRINLIKEKIYLVSESDKIENALIQKDGKAMTLQISNTSQKTHASRITLDGSGLENGYYTIKLNGANTGQFYVQNNKGVAMFPLSSALATAEVIIEKSATGANQAPQVSTEVVTQSPSVNLPISLNGIVTDDGAPNGAMTYQWEVVSTPSGGQLSFTNSKAAVTSAVGTTAGSYTARLTANDGTLSTSSLLTFVLGGGSGNVDKTELTNNYNFANSLVAANFTGQGLTPIAAAKTDAAAVIANAAATQAEVTLANDKLLADLRLLTPLNNNMAFAAKVSASYTSSWESLPAVKDGLKTAVTNPHWGSWGNTSASEYVQYDWPQGAIIDSSNLMAWNDGQGIKTPTKLEYSYIPKNSSTNAWVTAGTITTGIVALNTPVGSSNIFNFDPALEVKALRVTLTKPVNDNTGVGLWEWEVTGNNVINVDKTELTNNYNFANSLVAANFTGQGLTPIAAAKTGAAAVIANAAATQAEVTLANDQLLADLRLLTPLNNNMAFAAKVSASYTSSWESLSAVKDGLKTAVTNPHWGSWGNTSASEYVQYDWPQGATIVSSDLMVWNDGQGITTPTKLEYSYIPKNSSTNEWVTAGTITTGIVALNTPVGSSNIFNFNSALEVKALRVTLTKPVNNNTGVGLWEWEVIKQ